MAVAKTTRKKTSTDSQQALPDTPPMAPVPPRKPKQAVVIVHGMGEQKPLETLRGFVEAVWGARPIAQPTASPNDVWLVPDMRAGLTELARVTTRENKAGVVTDFYELYWSDLLVGNTMTQIRSWVTGLLLRWPHQVPKETFALWLALWAIVGVIAAIAVIVGLNSSLESLVKTIAEAEVTRNPWTAAGSVAFGLIALWLLAKRLIAQEAEWSSHADATHHGIWAIETPRTASVTVWLSRALVGVVPVVVAVLAYLYFPWSLLGVLKTWLLIAGAVIAWLLVSWVVPVFGDVARYVRTSPDAVSARSEIRERGVKLLRALHAPIDDRPSAKQYDFGNAAPYERVVVVGHSLGSIVAYDILRLFWQERGPTSRNPPTDPTLARLGVMEEYCRPFVSDPLGIDPQRLRQLQADVATALAAEPKGWRVTDFVTLGSPLTHAEFLVSSDRAAFEERKAERLFPTCPPMLEPGKGSFLYPESRRFAHHASMFAAMRWTNIFDPRSWLMLGDFISGPCRPNFGPGIIDIPVRIKRRGILGRLVTHTDYWNQHAMGVVDEDVWAQLETAGCTAKDQAHLEALRNALSLR
ncbi:MAG: hypothetical protein KF723_16760 [Rhizobiaceae bacterium]|nr:hypothetical protein [Rhizobiaceae bacterium]